jgi:hypothetical protein
LPEIAFFPPRVGKHPAHRTMTPPRPPGPPSAELSLRAERLIVGVILLVFFGIELNHINNLGFQGQDFPLHRDITAAMVAQPGQWFHFDTSGRPLIYWIGAACRWITAGRYTFELSAVVFLLMGIAALWLFHDSSRAFIRSPLLRLAAFLFITLLPLTLVTVAVFAADGPTLLPFVLAGRGLLGALRASDTRTAARQAALAGGALLLGNLIKATFFALPVAAATVIAAWALVHGLKRSRVFLVGALVVAVPLLASMLLQAEAHRALAQLPARHSFDQSGTGELTWRSLLGLKASDARILQAPSYWDHTETNGARDYLLLHDNGYSYAALFHLGVFTDIMNCANVLDRADTSLRPDRVRAFAVWAVRVGLLFSIAAIAAILAFWAATAVALLRRKGPREFDLLVWNAFALAWYLPITLTLPFVHHAYDWGYWLPRLVFPTVLIFSLTLFAGLDFILRRFPRGPGMVLGLVVFQTCLHLGGFCGFHPANDENDRPYTVLARLLG